MDSWARLLQRFVTRNRIGPRGPLDRRQRRGFDRAQFPGETLEERVMLSAWVTTDKGDYAPGQTATISAGGFAIGETVALQVVHDDGSDASNPAHQPWLVQDGGAGDLDGLANGQIQTTWAVGTSERNATLDLTAVGTTSHLTAATTFTDAPQLGSLTVGSQTGSLTYGTGGSVTYLVTVNRGSGAGSTGAFIADLDVTSSLPAGVTFSFDTSSLSFSAGDNTLTATLTLTSSNGTPASDVPFTVRAEVQGNVSDFVTGDGEFTVDKKVLTGVITAGSKVYDGTTTATILTRNLLGVVSGDDVSYIGGTATFADKNVGTGKTVTATGLSLSGTDAGNYTVNTTATTTANITARSLTITATGVNKVYDGTTAATVTLSDNRISGDVFTDVYSSAVFNNKNVGTSKPISVTGISITGTDAGNYTFNTTASASADITVRTLTVTATGVNKTYDGTTTATVILSDNRVSGDDITVTYVSADFSDKNVGTGKTITISGVAVSGPDSPNYVLSAPSTATANITVRPVSVTFTAANKQYDGTTLATINQADLSGIISGDSVSVSGGTANFDNKNVGNAKTVTAFGFTLSGADAGNYTVNFGATTTANITPRALTVTADAKSKVADAPDPALTYQVTSGSLLPGDAISGTLSRTPGSAPGFYPILQGTLTAGVNYAITYVSANLLIIAAGHDLTGPWSAIGQLASVTENGVNLTFVDQNNVTTTGTFTDVNKITGRGGLTATIDTSTADYGRLVWSDGVVWLRLSLDGQYYNSANNLLTSVVQNGLSLTLVNASGGTTGATLTGVITANVPGWGQTATFTNGAFNFSGGSVWKKLDLSPDYKNVSGDPLHVTADGTTLTFTNRVGATALGFWSSPTQVAVPNWGVTGIVSNGKIQWSNNSVWNKNLTVFGTGSDGTGVVSINETNNSITLTNKTGGTSRAQITAAGLVALDWGVTGTRTNGKIAWSNNTAWDNFDFNALDALFSDIRTLPFPA